MCSGPLWSHWFYSAKQCFLGWFFGDGVFVVLHNQFLGKIPHFIPQVEANNVLTPFAGFQSICSQPHFDTAEMHGSKGVEKAPRPLCFQTKHKNLFPVSQGVLPTFSKPCINNPVLPKQHVLMLWVGYWGKLSISSNLNIKRRSFALGEVDEVYMMNGPPLACHWEQRSEQTP